MKSEDVWGQHGELNVFLCYLHKIVVDQDAVDSVKWWRFGFSL